jgi:hypothetical protein
LTQEKVTGQTLLHRTGDRSIRNLRETGTTEGARSFGGVKGRETETIVPGVGLRFSIATNPVAWSRFLLRAESQFEAGLEAIVVEVEAGFEKEWALTADVLVPGFGTQTVCSR